MTSLRPVLLATTVLIVTTAIACSGDDSEPALTTTPPAATVTPTPTPLDRYVCDADVPEVRLDAAGASQVALPLVSEWAGPDCANGGPGATYYYLPTEPLQVSAQDPPTLVLASQPDELTIVAWVPDLADATTISSGETLLVMDPVNRPRRSSATTLNAQAMSEQQIDIAALSPEEYAIEILAYWPGGVATLSLHVVVTE